MSLVCGFLLSSVGPADAQQTAENDCLFHDEGFDEDGPFSFRRADSGNVTIRVPNVPDGCRVPVIHHANGTGARCSTYRPLLDSLASHGFIVACFESTQTGAGTQGITAVETVRRNFPDLVDDKIGSTGHSQGGSGAIAMTALAQDEFGPSFTFSTLAQEPAINFGERPPGGSTVRLAADIESPVFMFSGSRDRLVSERFVNRAFNALDNNTQAHHWSGVGATHIPVPNSFSIEVGVPWFRCQLNGDLEACDAFNALPETRRWNILREQSVADPFVPQILSVAVQ